MPTAKPMLRHHAAGRRDRGMVRERGSQSRRRPGAVGLELDVEVGVLRVRDLERGRVGRVAQQVPWDVAPVQRLPHLRAKPGATAPYQAASLATPS